jgi:hypothetical protein
MALHRSALFSFTMMVALGLVSACSSTLPVKTDSTAPSSSANLADLKQSAMQLRQQYEAMGQTLQWLEGEVAAAGRAHIETAPVAVDATPAKAAPKPHKAEKKAEKKAEPKAELKMEQQPAAAEVAPLTDDDKIALPEVGSQNLVYVLHLASYQHAAGVAPGWAQLSAANSAVLGALAPASESFTDKHGAAWQRLVAGQFATGEEAEAACAKLKAAGTWCEVRQVPAASLKPIN